MRLRGSPRDDLVQGSEEPGARGSTVWSAKLGSDGAPRRGRGVMGQDRGTSWRVILQASPVAIPSDRAMNRVLDRAKLLWHATYDARTLALGVLICTGRGRRSPGESPSLIAQTIVIEALVSLSLAAGEAHFSRSCGTMAIQGFGKQQAVRACNKRTSGPLSKSGLADNE